MALSAGTRLGPYEILAPLGAGGMGEVYHARDSRLGREVAIKILPEGRSSDPLRLRRFEEEARTVASLSHPHILALHDVGNHDSVQYAVMELLEGQTLRSALERGSLPPRKVVDYGVQICRGLAAAHERGVVHRDLKPENLFLTKDGQIKILDFGLAKLTGPPENGDANDSQSPTATEPGVVMGTAGYMSPEQARGQPADARSDLFSLGAVLYEMLSGRRAFSGHTAADVLSAILQRDPPGIEASAGPVPPELERVVRRCLEKAPEERIQSARDLAFALEPLSTTGGAVPANRRWLLAGVAALALLAVAAGVYLWLQPRQEAPEAIAETPAERQMLAVLPFENLGPADDAYFAAGMTDEITSRLAGVSGLGVISRSSAIRYQGTEKTLKQVGEELGVGFVLMGTVRWDRAGGGERVRITPRLIRVADDTHVWTDSYNRVVDDVFASQSEIAEAVVQQLGVALLPREHAALGATPTGNLEAYQAYLRGLEYWRDPDGTRETYEMAVRMFERAVALDPSFVEAHAHLADAHLSMYTYDNTPARLAAAREVVDRALALDTESPDAHLALGRYYEVGDGDRERALAEYMFVAEHRPNDSHAAGLIAGIRARQGRFDEAIADYERAFDLDPRNPTFAYRLAELHQFLGRYSEAHRYHDRAIATAPDKLQAWVRKAHGYVQEGRLDRARATAEGMPEVDVLAYFDFWSALERRERRYEAALDRLAAIDTEAMPASSRGLWEVLRGDLYRFAGQPERASASYEDAVRILQDAVSTHLEELALRVQLAQAYAGLGRRAETVRQADYVIESDPLSRDALYGSADLVYLAEACATAGEHDKALEILESLASIPSWMSYGYLRYEPALDPLREDPRFQKLLADKKAQLRPSLD